MAIQASLLGFVGLVVLVSNSQPTNPSVSYRTGFGSAIQNTTIDEVTSARVASTVARSSNLLVKDSVSNLADSLNAQISFAATNESFLDKKQVVTTSSVTRDDVISYTVKEGETVSDIAQKFNVTSDTISWANDLRGNLLAEGKELVIPPVDGVIHEVSESDTAESLAKKYKANATQIIAFNDAEVDGLPVDEKIIIPDGVKPAVVQTVQASGRVAYSYGSQAQYGGNGYSYGYCTWHAANRRAEIGRPIPTNLGHARTWAPLASNSGFVVSETPEAGAVLWHKNTSIGQGYGHVAFVERVNPDGSIHVSDMNWAGWNVLTYRTVTPGEFDQYLFVL